MTRALARALRAVTRIFRSPAMPTLVHPSPLKIGRLIISNGWCAGSAPTCERIRVGHGGSAVCVDRNVSLAGLDQKESP